MGHLDADSLAGTIDRVSEAWLFGKTIAEAERRAIAAFLVERHRAPGAYANMFAPTPADMGRDLVLFTGEKIKTNAGRRHMLGEEASRVLRKLGVGGVEVETALREADDGICARLAGGGPPGRYCCKSCSCALWLNLSAGGLAGHDEHLPAGLRFLKEHRDDKGRWRGFPYHYTLFVLNELEPDMAMDELKYAGKSIERWLGRGKDPEDKFRGRREHIGRSILGKIS